MPDEPVAGDDFVKPCEAALVGVAAVAAVFENAMDFWRDLQFRGCGPSRDGWAQELDADENGDREECEFGDGSHGDFIVTLTNVESRLAG